MSELENLFTKYGTDKGIWGYTPAYEKHLDRERIKNVLEIGICGFRDIPNNVVGASLFAWRDYLPNAEVYGIDNDNRFIFNDQPRIHTELANAYSIPSLTAALRIFREFHTPCTWLMFDFICDDAVHDPMPQIELCRLLWPFLNVGGVYAIEEACPYKCPNGSLDAMVNVLFSMHPDMIATEYQTHKDERLLVLTKV
jgi:hypothetical protein